MTTDLSVAGSIPADKRKSWPHTLVRGRESDAAWVRPALIALLAATALLYLCGLGASGWANSYYSAAVQAGAQSWEAFFFGSSDAANAITVDKTPLFLWPMEISARIFGLSSWSVLVPQALEGIAAVGLLYATVRRWFGPVAGLIAGAALAMTPVAVLMFRFNNPDAMLVLLLVAGAYACTRALENGSAKWLMLAGSLVGFGFLAKMLQALLVVPAFAITYLVAAPPKLGKRVWQLLLAGVAMVVSAGWWIAIVELWPSSSRPYVGGSQTNSVLELTLGYNGFGRITGNETGGLGNLNQDAGIFRLFGSEMGSQISWLLPAALLMIVALLWLSGKSPRTDRTRAAVLLWGGWLLVTGLVFSLSQGIIHPYYTVALAPAIAALVGIGVVLFWRQREQLDARLILAVTVAATAVWSFVLLSQADWLPWLAWVVLVAGLIGAVAIAVSNRRARWVTAIAVLVAIFAGAGGSTAYAVQTAGTAHTGAIPSAGPSSRRGGFGGGGRMIVMGNANGVRPPGNAGSQGRPPGAGQRVFGGGGLLDAGTVPTAVSALLRQNSGSYSWVAAVVQSNSAAGYQLATGLPVMAVGGFNGTDPSPTLAEFQRLVAQHKIHYFIGGNGGFGGRQAVSGSNASQQIATWVAQHYQAQTVGGVTLYDVS
ncbi:glycosyltransferase family 39 protein [Fodinicola acaciae]|uniref:glycosyltransferase family 39 protein n=1 Tax=Fodinicola acaciae TaxID=2681555 RepID=UPI0013D3511F|nr:glycosyltransferase family 39 protein [Fodinicola acaciae]